MISTVPGESRILHDTMPARGRTHFTIGPPTRLTPSDSSMIIFIWDCFYRVMLLLIKVSGSSRLVVVIVLAQDSLAFFCCFRVAVVALSFCLSIAPTLAFRPVDVTGMSCP